MTENDEQEHKRVEDDRKRADIKTLHILTSNRMNEFSKTSARLHFVERYGILTLKGCDTLKFDTRYTFSEEDIQAITLALPLVVRFGADDPIQNFRNEMLCESAGQKLLLHTESFDPNEIRILAAAVEAANLLLAGQISIDVSQEELAELKKHFFTYNKLKAPFDRMIDRLNRQFGAMR